MRGREICVDQRSEAWHEARLGRLNRSHAERMLAKGRGNSERDKAKRLRLELVPERLTGLPTQTVTVTVPMQRGIDLEPRARRAVEARGDLVQTIGYVQHADDAVQAGASPDGLMLAEDGDGHLVPSSVLEIKCPTSVRHCQTLASGGTVPTAYWPQLRHLAWITGLPITFASYDDRFRNPAQRLYVATLSLEQLAVDEYDGLARAFLASVEDLYEQRR